jgi:hypothetical protein
MSVCPKDSCGERSRRPFQRINKAIDYATIDSPNRKIVISTVPQRNGEIFVPSY